MLHWRSWLTADERDRKAAIFSLSVHPDGTRLATGGLGRSQTQPRSLRTLISDRKIKVWSTVPILDPEAEKDEANPKLLCTMSSHTGNFTLYDKGAHT